MESRQGCNSLQLSAVVSRISICLMEWLHPFKLGYILVTDVETNNRKTANLVFTDISPCTISGKEGVSGGSRVVIQQNQKACGYSLCNKEIKNEILIKK